MAQRSLQFCPKMNAPIWISRTLISVAALFAVIFLKEKKRKQPECPSIGKEAILLGYYAIIKTNKLDLYVRTCRMSIMC